MQKHCVHTARPPARLPFTARRILSSAQPKSLLALQTYTRESSLLGLRRVSTDTSRFVLELEVLRSLDALDSPSSRLLPSSLTDSKGISLMLETNRWPIKVSSHRVIRLRSAYSKGNALFSSS